MRLLTIAAALGSMVGAAAAHTLGSRFRAGSSRRRRNAAGPPALLRGRRAFTGGW